jgi:hypothetical protein
MSQSAVHYDRPQDADALAGAIAGLATIAIGFDNLPSPEVGPELGRRAAAIAHAAEDLPLEHAVFSLLLAAFILIEKPSLFPACAAHGPAYLEESASLFRLMRRDSFAKTEAS